MPKGQYDRTATRRPNPFAPAEEATPNPEPKPLAVSGDLHDEPEPEPERAPAAIVVPRRQTIDSAPKNGQEVLLFGPEIRHGVRAVWRKTRQFAGGRWRQNEYWACPTTQKPLGASWTEWEMSR